MNKKRENPQKMDHSVPAKKKPTAGIAIQCELETNTYRLAEETMKKLLALSTVSHSAVSNLF